MTSVNERYQITEKYLDNINPIYDEIGVVENIESAEDYGTSLGKENIPIAIQRIVAQLNKLKKSNSQDKRVLQAIQTLESTLSSLQNLDKDRIAKANSMGESRNAIINLLREQKQTYWKNLIDSGVPLAPILLPQYRAKLFGPLASAWLDNSSEKQSNFTEAQNNIVPYNRINSYEAQNNIVPYNPTKVLANA